MPPPAEGFAARLVLGPALRTQPDRRLVALVREGYETAFEEIVRRYGKALTRYAAAIVGPRSEDVTQDAFSKALLALRRNDAEIELRPWLFRIVRNTALNELRDRPPSPEVLAEAIAGGSNPAEELERREELADLMRRLQSLPEPQRAAIVMRELEGLSHEEIAAALGLSGGAARQAIYRARQALRDGLGMLLPLPLLRLLADRGGELAVAGAGVGGGAAAGGALGGGGAGVAIKASVVTVVLAGSVGTGIALEKRGTGGRDASAAAVERVEALASQRPPAAGPGGSVPAVVAGEVAAGEGSSERGSERSGAGSGHKDRDRNRAGPGGGESGQGPARATEEPEEHRGGRREPRPHAGEDRGRHGGGSHSGLGPSGGRKPHEDRGPGARHDGGPGSGADSGHGGPGGGEERSVPPPPQEPAEEERPDADPGSGGSGSESGSESGSSGPGPGRIGE